MAPWRPSISARSRIGGYDAGNGPWVMADLENGLFSGVNQRYNFNGTLSVSGLAVTVGNAAYNGSLAAGTSTTFGFLGSGAPSTPELEITTP